MAERSFRFSVIRVSMGRKAGGIGQRHSHANTIRLQRNESATLKVFTGGLENLMDCCSLHFGRDLHKTKNPRVRQAMQEDQFAEILVESCKNATFPFGDREDFIVTWICGQITCPPNIMPQLEEFRFHSTPDAVYPKGSSRGHAHRKR